MMLRPTFTEKLASLLLACQHVNLISPHGQGRRRTLYDLKSILPDALIIKHIDLKHMEENEYQKAFSAAFKDLNKVKHPTLLILHNFNGVQHLNDMTPALKLEHVTVLTVSEHQTGMQNLGFNNLVIPSILKQELMTEVEYRNLVASQDVEKLADWLMQQASPYTTLEEKEKGWFALGEWKL